MQPVRMPSLKLRIDALSPRFDPVDHLRIEEFPKRFRAEQLAKHVTIEGQRLRAALRSGHVQLIEIGRRIREYEGPRKGRRRARLDIIDRNLPRTNPRHQLYEPR